MFSRLVGTKIGSSPFRRIPSAGYFAAGIEWGSPCWKPGGRGYLPAEGRYRAECSAAADHRGYRTALSSASAEMRLYYYPKAQTRYRYRLDRSVR